MAVSVRIIRPAPTSSTIASATCATRRALRKRWLRGCIAPRAVSFNVSATSGRALSHAGARPKSTVVAIEIPTARTRIRTSSSPERPRAEFSRYDGASVISPLMPHDATMTPSAPPASASTALSVSSWRMTRQRPAPSALRTAISLARAVPRASSRFATLAHAINSTKTTAPTRTRSAGAVSPALTSRSAVNVRAPALQVRVRLFHLLRHGVELRLGQIPASRLV